VFWVDLATLNSNGFDVKLVVMFKNRLLMVD